ncbi:MAG: hypothetical protein LBD40_02325 [Puniceicoccales bacterium]|nr:hypothetical protein [Puniceicoccales bacterium]
MILNKEDLVLPADPRVDFVRDSEDLQVLLKCFEKYFGIVSDFDRSFSGGRSRRSASHASAGADLRYDLGITLLHLSLESRFLLLQLKS